MRAAGREVLFLGCFFDSTFQCWWQLLPVLFLVSGEHPGSRDLLFVLRWPLHLPSALQSWVPWAPLCPVATSLRDWVAWSLGHLYLTEL